MTKFSWGLYGIFFLICIIVFLSFTSTVIAVEPNLTFYSWAATPPMGWNSWDCFGTTVTEEQVKQQASFMAKELKQCGWEYIVVDIQWYEPGSKGHHYKENAILAMDEFGRLLPAQEKFPSAANGNGFKPLADYIHSKGLKFGIHMMRGIPRQAVKQNSKILGTESCAADIADTSSRCKWNPDMYGVDMCKPGAQQYYDSLFTLYASWGVDYIKVDDISRPYGTTQQAEIEAIRKAIDKTDRPIVLSLSPGATPVTKGLHVNQHANLWRISDDFWDNWKLLCDQFQRLNDWTPYRIKGAWPDADMLPLGAIRFGQSTRFTRDEQYTLMTLWCIARSPLMYGGDMTKTDAFTLSLLTNDEVLSVNQHSENNHQLFRRGGQIAWVADVPNSNDKYLAVFNTSNADAEVSVDLSQIGLDCPVQMRDLWKKSDITGKITDSFVSKLPPHGSGLYRVKVAGNSVVTSNNKYSAYLFAYFTGNGQGQEQIHFAVSEDGFNYKALNNNKPIINSKDISTSGGVRDPHILRSADGRTFYMVATDLYVPKMGWSNYAMVMMKSTDLIHWTSSAVNIPKTYPDKFSKVHRVWAPQTIYDEKKDKYMVYFSMKEGDEPDKIYYAYANDDFTGLKAAPKQLYFPPVRSNTRACIDADIIYKDGKYYLFYKAEDGDPGIKLAISNKLTEGYKLHSSRRIDQSRDRVEGSCIFKLNNSDDWILMYDVYTKGRYQFARSSDLLHFKVIDNEISMDFHPRHGTVMPITTEELLSLVRKWGSLKHLSFKATSESVKSRNVMIDTNKNTIYLPVKPGVDIAKLNPGFEAIAGITFSPKGAQDFSGGPVEYVAEVKGRKEILFKVAASVWHNPVLDGYYADPDIIYAEKTGLFYIYPTSDGFTGWSGTYFKVFSSDNLVDWNDQGVILDIKKDVSWADRNAWAPCIIEKKVNGQYKYFYYFTAAQKIGVAVSDSPTGPFTDSGKPLINSHPQGVRGGQEIDPDVFCDPGTGKYYLYWGNGYMAVAELNRDMISIKQDTTRVMTPDRTFREGTHVFYRKGKYYFLWSENDTRDQNYRVRYAISSSPTGPLDIPADNLVIAKDSKAGIYATGHNSTIKIPGKDQWYIVYHRFTYPNGIGMGRAAGYHRETCIDKLTFDKSGKIIQVRPTLEGIAPVK